MNRILIDLYSQFSSCTVSGNATYTESEVVVINIDGEDVACTYTTDSRGQLNGEAIISGDSITIEITASDVQASYRGSPAICESGSCAVATGEATLTRISGP